MSEIIQPSFDRVPAALRQMKQWVVWKAVPKRKRDGTVKITKVPYNPNTKRQASSSKSKTWGTFEQAVDAYSLDTEFAGIGFVFSSNDDFIGIDLDSCFNEDGSLRPDAHNAVALINSYTEKSPSGTGLHIICRGRLPGSGHCDNKNGREIYQEDRFFTITGEIVEDKAEVEERQQQVAEIYDEWFGAGSFRQYRAGDLQWDPDAQVMDLDSVPVTDYCRNLIRNGENMDDFLDVEGTHDRSKALFYVCREMVSNLINKETILSILTDPANFLAQAALERRDNDIESAQEWVWKYTLAKVVAQWEEERDLFDEVIGADDSDDTEDEDDGDGDLDSSLDDDDGGATPTAKHQYEKSNFEKNALIFLNSGAPLVRCQEQYYKYTGKFWEPYSEEQVERDVHSALRGRGFSMGLVNNTIKTVKRFAVKDEFKPAPTYVAFRNGVLDLQGWDYGLIDFSLIPHSPKLKTMSLLNFDFDAEAQCPQWLEFLNQVFEGDKDRELLLQQFMGYLLVYDYRWHKMLVMAGESRSGKGTIANVIRELVGHSAYAGASLSSLSEQFGLHPLVNAKVAVISDAKQTARGNISRAHEVLLNVAANDSIPVRRMYSSPITTQIAARIVMMANNVPRFADDADALYNRYLVLPFNVSFAGREDVLLSEKLKAEMSGIFNWAVQGLIQLAAAGKFIQPELGVKAADEMRVYSNPLGTFVERFLVQDTDGLVPCRDLFLAYQQFCRELDIKAVPNIEFGRRISKEAPWLTRVRRGAHGERVWMYLGAKVDYEALSDVIGSDFD